jgi:hypothetical protein
MRREFACQDLVANLLVELSVQRRDGISVQSEHDFTSNKGTVRNYVQHPVRRPQASDRVKPSLVSEKPSGPMIFF